MKSSKNSPKVGLSGGLAIGYNERLAQVSERADAIELGSGTHYLLARNGRGKTTLLRTLAGVLKPLGGDYCCEGRCQLLSEDLAFDRELPARLIFKALLKKKDYVQAMDLARELELDVCKPYGKLSTGNKRKVALLVAEFSVQEGRSDILLLDEPFTGLDAYARDIFQNLWNQRQDGVLRLVSCHPDFDSMEMESSVLISDGKIVHLSGEDAPKQWGDLKTQLN
ncbi:MAG: ATP-binding cassette domain-containing protein [Verrucomicrobiae bacterium]|nr:ATP-binding cassette domain-containing protein [Verrucomicrobiae bacterium]NNJ87362.1 ATP-binding cassette domain-containing protein [Akkermansiaceae bacterium]